MKYWFIFIILLSNTNVSACSKLNDLINFYNNKNYTEAYFGLLNRCDDRPLLDAHESYWEGKISEASGDTITAVGAYEFIWKLQGMKDKNPSNKFFFKTPYYPDSLYRLGELYYKDNNFEGYTSFLNELKDTNLTYYFKLQKLHDNKDKNSIKNIVDKFIKDFAHTDSVVIGLQIFGEFAVVQTEGWEDKSDPITRYYLKKIKNKWEIISTDANIISWEHTEESKNIPEVLKDYNVYNKR